MLTNTVQKGDWKSEKHVPVIEVVQATKGQPVEVKLSVGKEIGHPNTYEHYIGWFKLFFQPEGFPKPIEVGSIEFKAHGEGEVLTNYEGTVKFNTEKGGKLFALSYCNIHGLWENEEDLVIE